jgi:hypothetical protein
MIALNNRLNTHVGIACCTILVVMTLTITGSAGTWASNRDPIGNGPSSMLAWDHTSQVSVVEGISDIGSGYYRYSYQIANNEAAGIWHFGIYTTFPILAVSPFAKDG